MSFMREGDETAQCAQKTKSLDLMASYIPDNEVLVLPDGRFTCAIHPHQPVLDILAVLTAHHAGKKHLSSLKLSYGKKQPGEGTGQDPKQQNKLKTESKAEAPLLIQTRIITQNALHRAPHYNSCCQRKHRPEAPVPSVPSSPLPALEVEFQSEKISGNLRQGGDQMLKS